jgi:desulfoferrodoxin (superoxide reductase-like protein)
MDISANSFRDNKIASFSVTHDWDSESHVAEISVLSNEGVLQKFQIAGLSEINVSDENHAYIEFCSLIISPGRIYLSLDPYTEGVESDRDNFTFVGRTITALD